jgi:hypothetical protein
MRTSSALALLGLILPLHLAQQDHCQPLRLVKDWRKQELAAQLRRHVCHLADFVL